MPECVALGNRLAQQADHRLLDARVLDASGREKKLHDVSSEICAMIEAVLAGRTQIDANCRHVGHSFPPATAARSPVR
jgi:hypothetical protein